MILALRTDKPLAELYLYEKDKQVAQLQWEAHRQLTDTIHIKIEELLKGVGGSWKDISGIVVFKGPGSFTGLRIGISVANTIAYAQSIPIVSTKTDEWLELGLAAISEGKDEKVALPEYGGAINITTPKK